jgi:hypothetical protein
MKEESAKLPGVPPGGGQRRAAPCGWATSPHGREAANFARFGCCMVSNHKKRTLINLD